MEFTTKRVTSEDMHRFTKKYPFKIAIIHYRHLDLIFSFLRAGDEWRLLYFEKNAAILIHKSLLPAIRTEMGNVNLNPLRFKDVRNPDVLLNVFNFYVRLDRKQAGISILSSKRISVIITSKAGYSAIDGYGYTD